MCDGRRLKKRKTSTKRNTLNPVYNEAIVFDVPPENIDQISLLIAVMDYDRLVSYLHISVSATVHEANWCNILEFLCCSSCPSGSDIMKWSGCAGWAMRLRVWGETTGVRCWHIHGNPLHTGTHSSRYGLLCVLVRYISGDSLISLWQRNTHKWNILAWWSFSCHHLAWETRGKEIWIMNNMNNSEKQDYPAQHLSLFTMLIFGN